MHVLRWSLLSLSLLPGCILESTDTLEERGLQPFRDQWRVELDAPVTLSGTGALRDLLIGGVEHEDNFSNRGDVIVRFHDDERVVVELRRFTQASSAEQAAAEFDQLALWAFFGGDRAPMRPEQMQFPRPCVGETGRFLNGCGLRVYHQGIAQPLRSGADVRVTLPASYAGNVQVITQDTIADAHYLNRGNVCIEPTVANVSVEVERGVAFASVGGPGAVLDLHGDAADLWIDTPAELRSQVGAGYEDDADTNERCYADLLLDGFVATGGAFGSTRSFISGSAGPDPEPLEYDARVTAVADACDIVAFTEDPAAYQTDPNAQTAEVRGVLHMCNDCLRDVGCETLLDEL